MLICASMERESSVCSRGCGSRVERAVWAVRSVRRRLRSTRGTVLRGHQRDLSLSSLDLDLVGHRSQVTVSSVTQVWHGWVGDGWVAVTGKKMGDMSCARRDVMQMQMGNALNVQMRCMRKGNARYHAGEIARHGNVAAAELLQMFQTEGSRGAS